MSAYTNDGQRGFTLVEVLIAVVVIAVGMLGIAKVQALVLSSTGVSRTRALAAIEASSLAAAMHANRAYWSSTTVAPSASASTGLAASTDAGLGGALGSACLGLGHCTPVQLAGYDLTNWAADLKTLLPSATAAITCNPANFPVDCTITLSWTENLVGINNQQAQAQQAGNIATLQNVQGTRAYQLYVVP